MKISIVVFLFLNICISANAQKYWETGFWKKYVNKNSDDTIIVERYYKNGKLKVKGKIVNKKPCGDWYFYHNKYVIRSNYNGKYIFRDVFDFESRKIIIGQYENGEKIGNWYRKLFFVRKDSFISSKCYYFEKGFSYYNEKEDSISAIEKKRVKRENYRLMYKGGIFIDIGYSLSGRNFQPTLDLMQNELGLSASKINDFNFRISLNFKNRFYVNWTRFNTHGFKFSSNDDTVSYKIYTSSMLYSAGPDLIKHDYLDICPNLGIYSNKSYLEDHNDNSLAEYTNIGLNFEICIRGILINRNSLIRRSICTFSIRPGYQINCTKTNWKMKENYPLSRSPKIINNNGFYINFTFGICIKYIRLP